MAQLAKQGLITAVICSTPFEKLARTQAEVFGVPQLPLIMIPHPLGGIALDEVRARAVAAIPRLLELLREHMQ